MRTWALATNLARVEDSMLLCFLEHSSVTWNEKCGNQFGKEIGYERGGIIPVSRVMEVTSRKFISLEVSSYT